jgi:RNA polymerase sigma factor (sigma-70 family)
MEDIKEFWEKAYKQNASKIKGVCRRYVADDDIAEDVMHNAFLQAMLKIDSYTGKGCFDAWLMRVAINEALMHLRHQHLTTSLHDDSLPFIIDEPETDGPVGKDFRKVIENCGFTQTDLLAVIEQLPLHHKLVFNLYIFDGFTHIQIGKELNISPGTSKSHLARARKKIQKILYYKAMEKMDTKKTKKREALIWFVLPGNMSFIDTFFKRNLQSYSIEPVKNANQVFKSVEWDNLPDVSNIFLGQIPFFHRFKLFFVFGGIALLLVFWGLYKINSNTPNALPDTKIINEQPVPVSDSIYKTELQKAAAKEVATPKQPAPKPVIVKKKIVHRKPLTIKETVNVIDSTHEE